LHAMAAGAAVSPAIDLTTPRTYPLRLGNSILKPKEAARYVSLRYNRKQRLKSSDAACKLKWNGKGGYPSELVIKDEDGEYRWDGQDEGHKDNYVLLVRGEGREKEVVLEKLSGSHILNLFSTPTDNREERVRKQHEQLHVSDDDEGGDLFGEDGDAELPLDPNNPFDYRHFLKAIEAEKPKRPDMEGSRSAAGTPLISSHRPTVTSTSTPVARPTKKREAAPLYVPPKKRKLGTTASEKASDAKRVKAGSENQQPTAQRPTATTNGNSRAKQAPPKIRVDRKASLRRPSPAGDDSGELILENETPTSEKLPTRQTAMALALTGQLGIGGPISLRSAASSPASQRIASPMPIRPEGMQEDGEFDLGGADDDAEVVDEDADVEVLELPSPAAAVTPEEPRRESKESAAEIADGGADEDDLDAQLAAALGEDDAPAPPQEEEEESEEE
jgi:hypothetical protein